MTAAGPKARGLDDLPQVLTATRYHRNSTTLLKICEDGSDMRATFPLTLILAGSLTAQAPDLTPMEKQFQDLMTGAVLQGQSTRDGRPGLSDDKYTIEKIVKQSGDTWMFYARVQYQGKDVTVPFPIQVKWAGDTPVITLTEQALTGMGTYTARVLIYNGHYAGTWSGKVGGGKVFGRIVKE